MECEQRLRSRLVDRWFRDDYRWLRGWVGRKVDCTHNAEDIASETFVQVLNFRDIFAVQAPRALLSTIARRIMFEGWRRRNLERAYRENLADHADAFHPSPEEQLVVIEALVAVDRLLDGLSSNAKAAFLHHQLDGMTYQQIAGQLGVSVSRVQQYMVQAFKRVYLAMEQL